MKNLKSHLMDFFASVLAKVIVILILLIAILTGVLDPDAVRAAVQRLDEILPLEIVVRAPQP